MKNAFFVFAALASLGLLAAFTQKPSKEAISDEGYELESVISNAVPGRMTPLIMCYFKKNKT